MQTLSNRTVREIALEMPVTTRVFEEFKIDYCCRGRHEFNEACEMAGADPTIVTKKIEEIVKAESIGDMTWLNTASLGTLIGYIVDKHHVFTRSEIASLVPLMAKVASRHGETHTELLEMDRVFNLLCDELMQHLLKEENVLFPYVENLEKAERGDTAIHFSCFGSVQNPVNMMLREHDSAGDMLRALRELADDYKLPDDACPSFTALYHRLAGFERDLHQHIHLENNLLFPKALELEARVFAI
ncbi:MAG: iron-sulfur cluster repair di-iron protein [Acidobacteria bacterium]|nr:iron-sulfur cluster repair di-iron protein [Acidobacteriota bacterium]